MHPTLNIHADIRPLVNRAKKLAYHGGADRVGLRHLAGAARVICGDLFRQALRINEARADAESFLPKYAGPLPRVQRLMRVTPAAAIMLRQPSLNDGALVIVRALIDGRDLASEDVVASEVTAYGSLGAVLRGEHRAAKARIDQALGKGGSDYPRIHARRCNGLMEATTSVFGGQFTPGSPEGRLLIALSANEVMDAGGYLPMSILSKATLGPLAPRGYTALLAAARRLAGEGILMTEPDEFMAFRLSATWTESLYAALSEEAPGLMEERALSDEALAAL